MVERPVTRVGHEDDGKQGNNLDRRLESMPHQGMALWPPDEQSFGRELTKVIDQDVSTQ